MKTYVSRLSYDEEWEILKMAIAKKDVHLIRNMLRDGYELTLVLMEATYRFLDQSSLLLIVNAYPDDLAKLPECVLFLKERLEPKDFDNIMENNRKKMEKRAKEEALRKERELVEHFEEMEKEYGDSPQFYSMMVGEEDTFNYALNKYGEDALYKSLDKHGILYTTDARTDYDTWYLRVFSFEYLMSHNQIRAAAVWLTSAVCIHDIEDYDGCLKRIVEAGGLKHLIDYHAPLGYGTLFEDEDIRQNVKKMGAIGYKRLFKHAKAHFTVEDWYKWYELDPEEALANSKEFEIPDLWMLKFKYFISMFRSN